MIIDNVYNFKNSIRHFTNITNVKLPTSCHSIDINKLAWSEPFNFRIRKDDIKYRVLKIPNVLNFLCAYNCFKDYDKFDNSDELDMQNFKRLVPNLETGDFVTGVYDMQLEQDFHKLCIYDNLMKLDIKSYYSSIYTHHLNFDNSGDERFLSNLNLGNTNGLIMGNYISLYFAEKYLCKISDSIKNKIEELSIDCSFSYFSDDFYFFCNKEDNHTIINVFDTVLETFNLERNDGKIEIWEYLKYNNYYIVDKYWKTIISECRSRFDDGNFQNKVYFINQLIYRMTSLSDDKQRRIFVRTFFKSTYFQELNMNKYILEEYNCHQICYIYKFCPETMLYSIHKFSKFDYFKSDEFKNFLKVRYQQILRTSYNEEQLYYFYVIKFLSFDSILEETSDILVESNNQFLISYYLQEKLFNQTQIDKLKLNEEEEFWFQNYHLVLYSDLITNLEDNIKKYLLPEAIRENPTGKQSISIKQQTYIDFYNENLINQIPLIKNVLDIEKTIKEYMNVKIEERIEVFGTEED